MTASSGATSTNEYIPIMPVFASNIIPDLQQPADGVLHPIVKVDAIKYLVIFRQQVIIKLILVVKRTITSSIA